MESSDLLRATVGNPITLLIERLFWLGLSIFFVFAITTGIRRDKE